MYSHTCPWPARMTICWRAVSIRCERLETVDCRWRSCCGPALILRHSIVLYVSSSATVRARRPAKRLHVALRCGTSGALATRWNVALASGSTRSSSISAYRRIARSGSGNARRPLQEPLGGLPRRSHAGAASFSPALRCHPAGATARRSYTCVVASVCGLRPRPGSGHSWVGGDRARWCCQRCRWTAREPTPENEKTPL